MIHFMKTSEAVDHFGSKAAVARAIGRDKSRVTRWGDIVPLNHALTLEKISRGKVELVLADYRD